jgi:predicted permease
VLAASFDLGLQGYRPEQATNFVNEIERRARGLPGVSDVTFTNNVPLGERTLGGELWFDAREVGSAQGVESSAEAHQYYVRPGFFNTLGIGIVRGRDFVATDVPTSEHVAIVSEDFARHAWPGVDPIGKHVSTQGPKGPFVPVVGVVRDAMTLRSDRERPTLYLAQSQYPQLSDFTILVRTRGDGARLARPLTTMIRTLDKNLPVFGVQTMAQYRYDSLSESRVGSSILAIVGAVALSLACLGVYSVIAFSVRQRTREIGVRIALGAAGRQVTTMFVREGARLTAIGIAVGLGLSLGLAKLLASIFVGLSAVDALAFLGVAALLAGIAGAASWIPARRAATVDPMTALRAE